MDASFLALMQQRLEEHFFTLTGKRDRSGFSVFALEHCLNEKEVEHIRVGLRSSLIAGRPSSRHWLLWVIYATEVGYDYAGDEYWRSFEERTRGWEFHDRVRIRAWFRKFQDRYSGVIPSGPWAEHFSIIAWPITHAILPLYLQRQFTKLLYDLRFRLAARTGFDAQTVGRLLGVHGSGSSTRFGAFLQQEELTGQIVLALLGGERAESRHIHPPTLRRIVSDLERVRSTGEWLQETQRVVADRFKGIGRGSGPFTKRASAGSSRVADTSHLAIRPNLCLRHAGERTWSVFLEVKSFRPVAALSAEIQSFLNRTRCRLNGARDLKPTGWLLSGDRKGTLGSWPDAGTPLIHFERSHPIMDHLLESECRLQPGPIWLFRVGRDGIARHIAGRIVRPSLDYVVVSTGGVPDSLDGVSSCDLACTGVNGFRLAMPPLVSAAMTARLDALGLRVARAIRVWPAGLPGRGWDGEGTSEWLTTESPCFGIAQDHPVEELVFCLNDGPEDRISTGGTDSPVFVRLPRLAAGKHSLTVRARRSPELESVAPTPAAEGFVQLAVREPEPWRPGITSHPGLIVTIDPPDADLDTLWRNELSLSVNGPEGFAVTFLVNLNSAEGRTILSERVGGPMKLPITPQAWRDRLDRFLKDEKRAWRYLEAAAGTLAIGGETLGTYELRLEHEPVPVRWLICSRRHEVVARLVDDSGDHETDPQISVYCMERPLEGAFMTFGSALAGCVVAPPGGLFIAEHGPHRDVVFVSAGAPRQGFQGLGVKPCVPELSSSPRALAHILRQLGLWRDARLAGFLARLRHRQVVAAVVQVLYTAMCGKSWARAEKRLAKWATSPASLDVLARSVDRRSDFGAILRRRSKAGGTARETSTWFAETAARTNVCRDHVVSEFALRLASEPLSAADEANLEALLAKLVNNPALLRGARLVTLLLGLESWGSTNAATSSLWET